jgi:hypothetical protein
MMDTWELKNCMGWYVKDYDGALRRYSRTTNHDDSVPVVYSWHNGVLGVGS